MVMYNHRRTLNEPHSARFLFERIGDTFEPFHENTWMVNVFVLEGEKQFGICDARPTETICVTPGRHGDCVIYTMGLE